MLTEDPQVAISDHQSSTPLESITQNSQEGSHLIFKDKESSVDSSKKASMLKEQTLLFIHWLANPQAPPLASIDLEGVSIEINCEPCGEDEGAIIYKNFRSHRAATQWLRQYMREMPENTFIENVDYECDYECCWVDVEKTGYLHTSEYLDQICFRSTQSKGIRVSKINFLDAG